MTRPTQFLGRLFFALALLHAPLALHAQRKPALTPGIRVRVTAPAVADTLLVGNVSDFSADTLTLTFGPRRPQLLAVPVPSIERLEVSVGKQDALARLAGAGLGFGGGYLLAHLVAFSPPSGGGANIGLGLLPLLGIPVGAILGAYVAPHRYADVARPYRPTVSAPVPGVAEAAQEPSPHSESAPPPTRTQSISVLPLHFILGFYAGDYEKAVGRTITAGLGASYFSSGGGVEYDDGGQSYGTDGFSYSTLEGKLRYYPSGDVLDGLSFGATFGPTHVTGDSASPDGDDSFTALGVGFELARSHSMGVDRRFYYGYGGGLKRLYAMGGGNDRDAELVLPTLRLSIGMLF